MPASSLRLPSGGSGSSSADAGALCVEEAGNGRRWYEGGLLHRADGPAVERSTREEWYFRGELHRLGGPAVVVCDGTREWWEGGRRHRLDGPARIRPGGRLEWWRHGHLHRDDGPAVVSERMMAGESWSYREWWLDGQRYSETGYLAECELRRLASLSHAGQSRARPSPLARS